MTHEQLTAWSNHWLGTDPISGRRFPTLVEFAEGYRDLSVKLDTAEQYIRDLQQARALDLAMIQELDSERGALSVKLEEAQAERDYLREIVKASRGFTWVNPSKPELDVHMSVNQALHAVDSPWRIDIHETGQAIAVPTPETISFAMGRDDQRGEIVKACPQCGSWLDQDGDCSDDDRHDTSEPLCYRRVKGQP